MTTLDQTPQQADQHPSATPNRRRLAFMYFSGGVAWAAQLLLGYVLVGVACSVQSPLLFVVVSAVAGLVAIAASGLSFSAWRRHEVDTHDINQSPTLHRFLVSSSLVLNLGFVLIILVTVVLGFIARPCPYINMPLP